MFHLRNVNRRDMDLADSDLSTIIVKETLKDYEMLIEEIYKRLRSGAEAMPRFTCGMKTVAIWISRTQFVSLFFRFLNLLFNVLNGKTKLRHDYVLDPSSSIIKCYLKRK